MMLRARLFPNRIFPKLLAAHGVLILGAITLLGYEVVNRVEQHYLRQQQDALRTKCILVWEAIRSVEAEEPNVIRRHVVELGREILLRITLIGPDGTVLADSSLEQTIGGQRDNRPEILAARVHRFGSSLRLSSTTRQPTLYVALHAGDGPISFVRLAVPQAELQAELWRLRRVVLTASAVAAGLSLFLGFLFARRLTRPLLDLTQGVKQVAAGDFGHQVFAPGTDEIGQLARTFNDMSQRLAAQFAQLEEDRQQLRAVLSAMVEGVIAVDAEQRILFVNQRAAQLLGISAERAVGRKLWETIRQRSIQDLVRRCQEAGERQSQELEWSGATLKSVAVHVAPFAGPTGSGAVLVVHDTSELRRLERLRQDFVANVSHELKTPLSVIKACVETLLDAAVDDEETRRSFLQQIAEQSDRLHALILDLLHLARIESGQQVLECGDVYLGEVVQACLERHRTRAESKRLRLEAVPPDSDRLAQSGQTGGLAAWADEEALHHILDNLVDNAIKYTPPDGAIRVRWLADGESAVLEVQDTGVGIPERDLPRIFERFYRVDKARSRELGGTGLGLSIVKHLVQSMQGSVQAESALGVGSTFRVRLPRSPLA
jgi:two-component system phosphate regulon sensor histidine kinase PhoR